MSINVSEYEDKTIEERLATRHIKDMLPRASRRTNTVYKIDDLGSIACDIENSLNHISEKARNRILAYHWEGYTLDEIGEREGISHQSVKESLERAYYRMAVWLESPKEPAPQRDYKYAPYIHTRSFVHPPYAIQYQLPR